MLERLIDTYLTECVKDCVGLSPSRNWRAAVHLGDGDGNSSDDVGEASDDLGEWSLADNDKRTIDDGDRLGRSLESLTLRGDHLDVVNHLGRSNSRRDGSSKGQSGSEEVAERDHFCGGEESSRVVNLNVVMKMVLKVGSEKW